MLLPYEALGSQSFGRFGEEVGCGGGVARLGRSDRGGETVMQEYRILQSLDKDLAKQLAKTFPAYYSDLPINRK